MLSELQNLRFASQATLTAIWGAAVLLIALAALWAERRRVKRKHIDAVGWMPWTRIFFAALLVGITLLMMALKGWRAE